jgi:hypothetical protein
MLQYTVCRANHRDRVYNGIASYRMNQNVPIRTPMECETWLVTVNAGGVEETWVVQVSPEVDGFAELRSYYNDTYEWPSVQAHSIRIDESEQRLGCL